MPSPYLDSGVIYCCSLIYLLRKSQLHFKTNVANNCSIRKFVQHFSLFGFAMSRKLNTGISFPCPKTNKLAEIFEYLNLKMHHNFFYIYRALRIFNHHDPPFSIFEYFTRVICIRISDKNINITASECETFASGFIHSQCAQKAISREAIRSSLCYFSSISKSCFSVEAYLIVIIIPNGHK